MRIVDSQVHIWENSVPAVAMHRQIPSYSTRALLEEMDEAGVDAAVIHPPSWDPGADRLALDAARQHPSRVSILGKFPLDRPESRSLVDGWKQQPGMLGLRFVFLQPHQQTWPVDGTIDWLWPAAESAGLPVALMLPDHLAVVGQAAERHPGLKLIVDHLGRSIGKTDDAAFENIAELLALAKYPNVAVKASGAPSYSTERYPFRNIHGYLEQIYDSYGPRRMFWGTDITRMPCSWRQCVTMFTRGARVVAGEGQGAGHGTRTLRIGLAGSSQRRCRASRLLKHGGPAGSYVQRVKRMGRRDRRAQPGGEVGGSVNEPRLETHRPVIRVLALAAVLGALLAVGLAACSDGAPSVAVVQPVPEEAAEPLGAGDAAPLPSSPDGRPSGSYGFSHYFFEKLGGEVVNTLVEGPKGEQVRSKLSYLDLKRLYDSGVEPPPELRMSRQELGNLVSQLDVVREVTSKYQDMRLAISEGFLMTTDDVPNMGAHFVHPERILDGEFDPSQPEFLLYTPHGDDDWELVGTGFILPTGLVGPEHPSGFAGPLDNWHVHYSLCIGDPVRARSAAKDDCEARGGSWLASFGWMIHAYVWEDNPLGVFSMWNPNIPPVAAAATFKDGQTIHKREGGEAEVVIENFNNPEVQIKAGETVFWTNVDGVSHTVTAGSPGYPREIRSIQGTSDRASPSRSSSINPASTLTAAPCTPTWTEP